MAMLGKGWGHQIVKSLFPQCYCNIPTQTHPLRRGVLLPPALLMEVLALDSDGRELGGKSSK